MHLIFFIGVSYYNIVTINYCYS